MSRIGNSISVVGVDSIPEPKECGICNRELVLTGKNVIAAGSLFQALRGWSVPSDVWKCPNIGKDWHHRAEDILLEAEHTSSPTLKKMLLTDVEGIVGSENANYPSEPY